MTPETKDKLKTMLKTIALVGGGSLVGGGIGAMRGGRHLLEAVERAAQPSEHILSGAGRMNAQDYQQLMAMKGVHGAASEIATGGILGGAAGLGYDAITDKSSKAETKLAEDYNNGFLFKLADLVGTNSPIFDMAAGAFPVVGPAAVGAMRGGSEHRGSGAAKGIIGGGVGMASGAIAGGISGSIVGLLLEMAARKPHIQTAITKLLTKAKANQAAHDLGNYGTLGGVLGASIGLGTGGAIGTHAATSN